MLWLPPTRRLMREAICAACGKPHSLARRLAFSSMLGATHNIGPCECCGGAEPGPSCADCTTFYAGKTATVTLTLDTGSFCGTDCYTGTPFALTAGTTAAAVPSLWSASCIWDPSMALAAGSAECAFNWGDHLIFYCSEFGGNTGLYFSFSILRQSSVWKAVLGVAGTQTFGCARSFVIVKNESLGANCPTSGTLSTVAYPASPFTCSSGSSATFTIT